MDESTLNDLLECSVCLERLEDSKVLPCQHTFCKKCLEVIVVSQKELRCPECRILVDTKVDDLPPNVLLMRILEGLKNSANQNSQTGDFNSQTTNISNLLEKDKISIKELSSSNLKYNCKNFNSPTTSANITHNQQKYFTNISNSHQTSPRLRQSNSSGVQNIPKAFALYDFKSKNIEDLQFHKGDVILIKKRIDSNWLYGTLKGREGAFPVNYVQIIVPLPIPQCIALYDFKMGPNEEEGCLTFKKGTVINVLRRVDQNWVEGRIGSSIGIFPIAFAEMNSLAKQILQQQELEICTEGSSKNSGITNSSRAPRNLPPLPLSESNLSDSTLSSSSSSSVLLSPNSTCSSSSNSISSSPINQSQNKVLDKINLNTRNKNANKEKRNSLNSLCGNKNLSIAQANRHSAEILSLPQDKIEIKTDRSQINSDNVSFTPINLGTCSLNASSISNEMKTSHKMNVLKPNLNDTPILPWCYLALYPYKPKKDDELELKKGCVYIVTERCLDGWYKGKNWMEKSGVFPGNYVIPLKSRDHQQLIHQKIKSQGNEDQQPVNPCHCLNTNSTTLPELPPRTPNNHLLASTSSSVSNLMKRLTNIKRSKSPTTQNVLQPNDTNIKLNESNDKNPNASHPLHVRSGSCPSQLLQHFPIAKDTAKENIGNGINVKNESILYGSQRLKGQKERPTVHSSTVIGDTSVVVSSNPVALNLIHHRKTQSLDATCQMNQLTVNNSIKTSNNREGRFRCIVSYPPNSEFELELNVGDIVFVHRKQKNGWYKGTHSQTKKTGLFPASFVEPLL